MNQEKPPRPRASSAINESLHYDQGLVVRVWSDGRKIYIFAHQSGHIPYQNDHELTPEDNPKNVVHDLKMGLMAWLKTQMDQPGAIPWPQRHVWHSK